MQTANRALARCLLLLGLFGSALPARALLLECDLEQQVGDSDKIVVAAVGERRSYVTAEHGALVTEYTLQVSDTVKGIAEDRIKLIVPGGEMVCQDGVRRGIVYPDMPRFSRDEQTVLFLRQDCETGKYHLTAASQSKMEVADDSVTGQKQVRCRARTVVPKGATRPAVVPGFTEPLDEFRSRIRNIERHRRASAAVLTD